MFGKKKRINLRLISDNIPICENILKIIVESEQKDKEIEELEANIKYWTHRHTIEMNRKKDYRTKYANYYIQTNKQSKIIELMAEEIMSKLKPEKDKYCEYYKQFENMCGGNCKDCIKRYFENKAKENSKNA